MFASASTMSVESSITMMALEPLMLPACNQRIEIIGQIEHVDSTVPCRRPFCLSLNFSPALKTLAEDPPGMTALSFRPSRRPPPKTGSIDEFADGGLADFDFVIAGLLDVAAEADDAGAGVVGRAELGEFRAAHGDDVLHVAERLDVVDDGRAHVEAEHRREIGRLDARIRPLAFQRLDQAGFLAADVGARAAMDVDFQIVAACPGCSCRGNSSRGLPASA